MIRETKCRRCGKSIIMIKTIKNKTMPADEEPVRIRLGVAREKFLRADGGIVWGEKTGDANDEERSYVTAYRPHIVHCRKKTR